VRVVVFATFLEEENVDGEINREEKTQERERIDRE